MKSGKKIVVLGAGHVGATVTYTLAVSGFASELVMIDLNQDKAHGEAMDIIQGTPFCPPAKIYAGGYADAADADIVIITAGVPRKPGQTRIDLAQTNIDTIKEIMPNITKYAPDAIYIIVSNPVDIITYTIIKTSGLPENHVIGSGTMLDSARLRSHLANHVHLSTDNVHGYVFGEHGDTAMIPWSLITISGMVMTSYCQAVCDRHNQCGKIELHDIEEDVRTSGAKVIAGKGATFYAVSLAVRRIVECVLRDTGTVLTVSSLVHNRYGIDDVCLSLPYVIGAQGIIREITPPLSATEEGLLRTSADALKSAIQSLKI